MPAASQFDLEEEITTSIAGPLYDTQGKFIGDFIYTLDEAIINRFLQAFIDTYEEDSRFYTIIDLETTGLDPHTSKIILVSICWDGENSLVFDYRRVKPSLFGKFLDIVPIGNTNLKFDLEFLLANESFNPTAIFDTQLGCQMGWAGCWPGGRFFNLEAQCEHLLKGLKLNKAVRNEFIGMPDSKNPTRKQIEYAAIDTIVVHSLITPISNRLENTGMLKLFSEVEMPLIPVLAKSELKGVPIDFEFLERKVEEGEVTLKKSIEEINNSIAAEEGGREFLRELSTEPFNPRSSTQVPKVLRFLKIPAKNAQAAHLETLRTNFYHPILEKIMEYRSLADELSRFANKYPKHLNPATGRVHPSFQQIEAVTGRLSCKEPPMQGVAPEFRPMVVAPEGYMVGKIDYSAFEMRAIAAFSGEEVLLESFHNRADMLPVVKEIGNKYGEADPDGFAKLFTKGKVELTQGETEVIKKFLTTDVHRQVGSILWDKDVSEINDTDRSVSKTLNYAILYLAEPPTIQTSLAKEGVIYTLDQCSEIKELYDVRFPKIKKFKDAATTKAIKERVVVSHLGRTRWFDLPPTWRQDFQMLAAAAQRESVNYYCQSSNANAIKMAMPVVQNYIDTVLFGDAWIPLNVHDELVEIARKEKIVELLDYTEKAMVHAGEVALNHACPVECSRSINKYWDK